MYYKINSENNNRFGTPEILDDSGIKASGLYTKMAMYIDARLKEYPEKSLTRDEEEIIYKYLYWIVLMLVKKKRFITKNEDVDEFSAVAAGQYYVRLTDSRQWDPTAPKQLTKITSILNYIKKTLYPMCVDWKRDNFSQIINPEAHAYIDTDKLAENMKASIQASYNNSALRYIEEDIDHISSLIKQDIKECQYRSDKLLCQKLYVSCVLSLLDTLTPPNSSLAAIKEGSKSEERMLVKTYSDLINVDPILWHLDNSYTDYVRFLVNKIRLEFVSQIKESVKSFTLDEDTADAILKSAYSVNIDIKEYEGE